MTAPEHDENGETVETFDAADVARKMRGEPSKTPTEARLLADKIRRHTG